MAEVFLRRLSLRSLRLRGDQVGRLENVRSRNQDSVDFTMS
jgi:hypothetical protein